MNANILGGKQRAVFKNRPSEFFRNSDGSYFRRIDYEHALHLCRADRYYILTNLNMLCILLIDFNGRRTMDERKTALIFKAFCDENRIRILKLLCGGEKCACKLLEEMSISQPTLSHHMKILCDSGIVVGRKEGKWMHYRISPEGVQIAKDYLNGLTAADPARKGESCCES